MVLAFLSSKHSCDFLSVVFGFHRRNCEKGNILERERQTYSPVQEPRIKTEYTYSCAVLLSPKRFEDCYKVARKGTRRE
ncbi:hypothetical protein CEXT_328461 [Caerostris extrusa]|uniref:Uncharacterized protein n=1 Tax=Caerostris extrusa TaxID=172846 RepID=A0AAV4U276_CAEEX|nr:hypothetical protein CEXT_328461 [Caerostris extrusa]